MTYHVLNTDFVSDDIDDVIAYCIEDDYHEEDDYFAEWVDEIYPNVEIAGMTFTAYEILDKFDCLDGLRSDFCESQNESDIDNARWELRHADSGEIICIQRYEVEATDDEEEEGEVYCLEQLRSQVNDIQSFVQNEKNEEEKSRNEYEQLFQRIGGS